MRSLLLSMAVVLACPVAFAANTAAPAALAAPVCLDNNGNALDVNNDAVLNWKSTTANQFHARGHIQGTLVKIYPDYTGHHHLEIQIGQNRTDTIEVIYNEDFGATPSYAPGSTVESCGDYITANNHGGGGAPSPDGAILHWVHASDTPRHPSGYLIIDGVLCGNDPSGN